LRVSIPWEKSDLILISAGGSGSWFMSKRN